MNKASKQKIIDFISFLQTNNLVRTADFQSNEGCTELTLEPATGVSLHYKDREVLQISTYGEYMTFTGAMVIAVDGIEHVLEEDITPKTLKHFEAFKKFKLPV